LVDLPVAAANGGMLYQRCGRARFQICRASRHRAGSQLQWATALCG
jgi:hypothetical protein